MKAVNGVKELLSEVSPRGLFYEGGKWSEGTVE